MKTEPKLKLKYDTDFLKCYRRLCDLHGVGALRRVVHSVSKKTVDLNLDTIQ